LWSTALPFYVRMATSDPLLGHDDKSGESGESVQGDDVHPFFKLDVEIELKLMQWDGNQPPFCRVWLADDWAQESSKPVKLQEKEKGKHRSNAGESTPVMDQADVVMEQAVLEVHKGYRYLLIDFHKPYPHTKEQNEGAK